MKICTLFKACLAGLGIGAGAVILIGNVIILPFKCLIFWGAGCISTGIRYFTPNHCYQKTCLADNEPLLELSEQGIELGAQISLTSRQEQNSDNGHSDIKQSSPSTFVVTNNSRTPLLYSAAAKGEATEIRYNPFIKHENEHESESESENQKTNKIL